MAPHWQRTVRWCVASSSSSVLRGAVAFDGDGSGEGDDAMLIELEFSVESINWLILSMELA